MVLSRVSLTGVGAVYRVEVQRSARLHRAEATLGPEGLRLTAWDDEPEASVLRVVSAFLRKLSSEGAAGTWPRRLTRWRAIE